MLFRHTLLLKARASDLNDPVVFEHYARLLVGKRKAPKDPDFHELLTSFLKDLPPPVAMRKIVRRLRRMALAHGAILTNFRWWDIVRKERALLAKLQRDGRILTVRFFWKKSEKHSHPTALGSAGSLLLDPKAFGGWRIDIEASTYEKLKLTFDVWLSKPLVLPTP